MALIPRVLIKGGATDLISCSLPGFDVTALTAGDIDKLAFDSRWAGLQIYMQGTLTAAGNSSGGEGVAIANFPATLPEIPLMMGYVKQGTNAYGWTPTVFRGNSEDYWWAAQVTTSLVQFRSQAFAATLTLYYTIFQRPSG
jgi:hypothetical protein